MILNTINKTSFVAVLIGLILKNFADQNEIFGIKSSCISLITK